MRVGVISDIHFGNHHKKGWDLTVSILPQLNLDLLLLLGDIIEHEPFSRFTVPPDRRLLLQHEFDVTKRELGRLRSALPSVPMKYIPGNHEEHLDRYLYQKAPELFGVGMVSLRHFLQLDDLDIEWMPPGKQFRVGKLLYLHGHEIKVGSVYPARNLYFKINGNVYVGHYHVESKYIHTLGGSLRQEGAWVGSCLRELRPSWAPFANWTLGFGDMDFSAGGFFHVDQHLYVKRGNALWTKINGKEYSL